MKLQKLTWLDLFWISLVALTLVLVPGMVIMAQEAIIVQLDPVGESEVSGTATLTAAGNGTNVVLDIEGLAPGANAQATMHANTCALPSASFTPLPALNADATGRATATGSVLFRGMEDIALATIADGEHIIIIQTEQIVACGVIPKLASASAPPTLPVTGGPVFSYWSIIVVILGLCIFFAGLLLWPERPRHIWK